MTDNFSLGATAKSRPLDLLAADIQAEVDKLLIAVHRHKAAEGECVYCDRERAANNNFHPAHDASVRCESGLPRAATTVSVAPVTLAYLKFMTDMAGARPRELRVEASPDALAARLLVVEVTMLSFKDYLSALLEDTAQNASFSHPMHEIVDRFMSDMADEIRGQFVDAIEDLRGSSVRPAKTSFLRSVPA